MNIANKPSQNAENQFDELLAPRQVFTKQHEPQKEGKKKKKCHGNRNEQQKRRRLRRREERQQLEPMDQDDRSQEREIQVE